MIKNIAELESSLKLKEGTLSDAINSESEVEIEMPTLVIRTTEEDEAWTGNLKTEFHKAGREIAIKEARTDEGLEFEGKTMKNFATALRAKVQKEFSIEPNARIKELETDNETLRTNFSTLETTLKDTKATYKAEGMTRSINADIEKALPADGLTIPRRAVGTLFKDMFEIGVDEDGLGFLKKDGKILKDELTAARLIIADVMPEFLTDYTKAAEGGAGGSDQTGGATGSMDAFNKEMAANNIGVGSAPYNREMTKRINDKTLKV
jgi:hypothetical protein